MDAETLLERLCARHGVDPKQGARLLPLVQWALKGPRDSRDRILAVVERTLADDGAETHRAALNAAAEHAVLVAVARILHDWSPAERFLGLDLERPELLGDEDATRG